MAGVILVAVIIIVACYVIRRRKVGKKESAPWSSNGGVTLDVRTHVSYIFLKRIFVVNNLTSSSVA